MFAIFLDDIGPDRIKAMKVLREVFSISMEDAKRFVSDDKPMLKEGPPWYLRRFRDELAKNGLIASIGYYPAGDDRSWIPDELSMDKRHCLRCGAELFIAQPGLTTPEDIRQFARSCRLPAAGEYEQSGWIHPGAYCPNGCGYALTDFD